MVAVNERIICTTVVKACTTDQNARTIKSQRAFSSLVCDTDCSLMELSCAAGVDGEEAP
jgi:hypothetical protein